MEGFWDKTTTKTTTSSLSSMTTTTTIKKYISAITDPTLIKL